MRLGISSPPSGALRVMRNGCLQGIASFGCPAPTGRCSVRGPRRPPSEQVCSAGGRPRSASGDPCSAPGGGQAGVREGHAGTEESTLSLAHTRPGTCRLVNAREYIAGRFPCQRGEDTGVVARHRDRRTIQQSCAGSIGDCGYDPGVADLRGLACRDRPPLFGSGAEQDHFQLHPCCRVPCLRELEEANLDILQRRHALDG